MAITARDSVRRTQTGFLGTLVVWGVATVLAACWPMGTLAGAAEGHRKAVGPEKAPDAAEQTAEPKADSKIIAEELAKAKKAEEEKRAKILAKMPPEVQERSAYSRKAEEWDAAACRKEMEEVVVRKQQVADELRDLPQKIFVARQEGMTNSPEIKILMKEIGEKQAMLKKLTSELEPAKSLEALDQSLRKETTELEWRRNFLAYRLVKLGDSSVLGTTPGNSATKTDAGKKSDLKETVLTK
jgi:hypothetical protein